MNNYRITYHHNRECDYWGKNKRKLQAESHPNFRAWANEHYPLIKDIIAVIRAHGVRHVWWFHEPFIEITWLCDDPAVSDSIFDAVDGMLKDRGVTDMQRHPPANGNFGEWFCRNEREREFGAKRYALASQWVELYREYQADVDSGMGVHAQVGRTVHGICNPLGLNYWDEAKVCFSRGLICVLFRFLPFARAVWVYKNIFRQVYT